MKACSRDVLSFLNQEDVNGPAFSGLNPSWDIGDVFVMI